MPNAATTCCRYSSSSGPVHTVGGAAKDSVSAPPARSWERSTGTRPARQSCTTRSSVAGVPPFSSQACAEPRVGCPAKGSSPPGVKIRSRQALDPGQVAAVFWANAADSYLDDPRTA
jgi:hypothetical protein